MRLPPIHPSALDPVQKDLYDDMRAGIATGFNGFRTALDDGSMIGPWNASLHHPTVGKASWQLTQAVNALATLPVNVKEVAILVVGGFHKASYEIYAHVAVAERLGMPLPIQYRSGPRRLGRCFELVESDPIAGCQGVESDCGTVAAQFLRSRRGHRAPRH